MARAYIPGGGDEELVEKGQLVALFADPKIGG
jgi:hypothetical protein